MHVTFCSGIQASHKRMKTEYEEGAHLKSSDDIIDEGENKVTLIAKALNGVFSLTS